MGARALSREQKPLPHCGRMNWGGGTVQMQSNQPHEPYSHLVFFQRPVKEATVITLLKIDCLRAPNYWIFFPWIHQILKVELAS